MVSIHDRPVEVKGGQVAGHWKGDLLKGARNASAVGTLVECKSRFLLLGQGRWRRRRGGPGRLHAPSALPAGGPTPDTDLRPGQRDGPHQELARRVHIRVYFADPHSPWQRPTNMNTNGLLREYLPKGMDLSGLSQRYLTQVATALNTRQRKCLGFATPAEVLAQEISRLNSLVALQT